MNASPTILLIDDEALIMNTTAGLLRSAGFAVHTCDFWPNVMRTISETDPDLILLDYNMPGLKGDEICSVLKRNLPGRRFKIAIFSSEDEDHLRDIVDECGADGYLSKVRGRAHIVEGVCEILS